LVEWRIATRLKISQNETETDIAGQSFIICSQKRNLRSSARREIDRDSANSGDSFGFSPLNNSMQQARKSRQN
jgi:hypothetical protein